MERAKVESPEEVDATVEPTKGKTPLYEAFHAARYHRQDLIREIQENTRVPLLSFVGGRDSTIERSDTLGFVDLLHNLKPGDDLDLLLHTNGGDVDAAEKLMEMVRSAVGEGRLRVIVPDHAKSAGTLMALAADQIIMSNSSELGPIDPQIPLSDGDGNELWHSVSEYLDSFERFTSLLAQDPSNETARIMVDKFRPYTVVWMERVRDRARVAAEKFLKRGSLLPKGDYTRAAALLLDPKEWLSHGQPIGWEAARDRVGLDVQYLPPSDDLWHACWRLYCLQRLAIENEQRIFESEIVSLIY